jgi:hypothetical protein
MMKILFVFLILSSMHLYAEEDEVVWRSSEGKGKVEVRRHDGRHRWGGEGQDELWIRIRWPDGGEMGWAPFMCSVAGLMLEGIAMDAREREIPVSGVVADGVSKQKIRFTKLGDVEIISGTQSIRLSRKEAIAMAVAVHREYLKRIEDRKESKGDLD